MNQKTQDRLESICMRLSSFVVPLLYMKTSNMCLLAAMALWVCFLTTPYRATPFYLILSVGLYLGWVVLSIRDNKQERERKVEP